MARAPKANPWKRKGYSLAGMYAAEYAIEEPRWEHSEWQICDLANSQMQAYLYTKQISLALPTNHIVRFQHA